jgi:hypothetical protein
MYEELNFEVVSIVLWILLHGILNNLYSQSSHITKPKKFYQNQIKDDFLE